MEMTFTAVAEDWPDQQWQCLFDRFWPSYESWYLSEGIGQRPTYRECYKKLKFFMPELLPLYQRVCDLAGGGDLAARFLSGYRPPPYLSGCSQAVWTGDGGPVLVRNYDYSPALCEGVMISSCWSGQRVIAMSDCLTGVLDGINESGLVASLTFGGRNVVGDGFGMPLVLRYLLETCTNISDAAKLLQRIPVHMAYNVTLLDKAGQFMTAYVSPDQDTVIRKKAVATNHQTQIDWPQYAATTKTLERENFLQQQLDKPGMNAQSLLSGFFKPPLFCRQYESGFGTLYTAAYRPDRLQAGLFWHNASMIQNIGDFSPAQLYQRF